MSLLTPRILAVLLLVAGASGLALYCLGPWRPAGPSAHSRAGPPQGPAKLAAPSSASEPPLPSTSPPDLAAALPLRSLTEQINGELVALGLPPAVRVEKAQAAADRLTLTFNSALRHSLGAGEVTALDELIEALSRRVLPLGFRHLALYVRVAEDSDRAVPIDELFRTPPSKKPLPDPIDDGVRK